MKKSELRKLIREIIHEQAGPPLGFAGQTLSQYLLPSQCSQKQLFGTDSTYGNQWTQENQSPTWIQLLIQMEAQYQPISNFIMGGMNPGNNPSDTICYSFGATSAQGDLIDYSDWATSADSPAFGFYNKITVRAYVSGVAGGSGQLQQQNLIFESVDTYKEAIDILNSQLPQFIPAMLANPNPFNIAMDGVEINNIFSDYMAGQPNVGIVMYLTDKEMCVGCKAPFYDDGLEEPGSTSNFKDKIPKRPKPPVTNRPDAATMGGVKPGRGNLATPVKGIRPATSATIDEFRKRRK